MKTGKRYRFVTAFLIIAGSVCTGSCFTDMNKNKNLLELAVLENGLGSNQGSYPGAAGTLRFIHYTNDMEYSGEKILNVKVDKKGKMTIDTGSLEYTLDYEFEGGQTRLVEHFNLNFAPTGQCNTANKTYDVIENTSVVHRIEYYVKDEHGQWVKFYEDTENTTWDGGLHFDTMEGMDEYRIVVASNYVTIEWQLCLVMAIP